MPGPADERIKRYLERRDKEAADKVMAEAETARLEEERRVRVARFLDKWSDDTHVITEVLVDLQKKLAAARARFYFQDVDEGEKEIARGRITGELDGEPLELTLIVGHDGTIQGGKSSQLVHSGIRLVSPTTFPILTANAGEYEALILDLLGLD